MIGAEGEGRSSLENQVLRARARGEISADDAFDALFREYRRTVAAWLAVRVEGGSVDDLAQDVWLIFYNRFRRWEFGPEMESPESRPVLSFLFRTCQFVARGHARLARTRKTDPLESAADPPAAETPGRILRDLEARQALSVARRICPEETFDVLLAKLAGMSAKEIARALLVSEAVVDHRYRDAIARLRSELGVES